MLFFKCTLLNTIFLIALILVQAAVSNAATLSVRVSVANHRQFQMIDTRSRATCFRPSGGAMPGVWGRITRGTRVRVGATFSTWAVRSFSSSIRRLPRVQRRRLEEARRTCVAVVVIPTASPTETPMATATPTSIATATPTATPTATALPDACHDAIDNDGDGATDVDDPGCSRNTGPVSELDGCLNGSTKIYYGVEHLGRLLGRAADGFQVGKAIMLYEAELGNPRIVRGVFENGGLPQVAVQNMRPYLDTLVASLGWRARTTDFSGPLVVIIDLEAWQVNYNLIASSYQSASRARVQAQHPSWTFEQLDAQARIEWEAAAVDYMLQTIAEIKRNIPGALVGWYGQPLAWRYEYGYQGIHGARYRSYNDSPAMGRVLDALDILTPEFYLHVPVGGGGSYIQQIADNRDFMIDAIEESARVMSLHNNLQGVIPIVWYRFHDSSPIYGAQFLSPLDLDLELFTSLRTGVSGIYIWGNEDDLLGGGVSAFAAYYRDTFAPMVKAFCAQSQTVSE